MEVNNLRKTHPVVLIVAVAITVFSLLVSAAIAGWIPGTNFENQGAIKQSASQQTTVSGKQFSTAGNKFGISKTPVFLRGYKRNIQPRVLLNLWANNGTACATCGKIVSINPVEQQANGFVIKIHMENGNYRSVTQDIEPNLSVGDEVRLSSSKFTQA